MTAATPTPREHLGNVLSPIEAVLLDRVDEDWDEAFYEQVVDAMSPWPIHAYPLEAAVASLVDSLQDAPADLDFGPYGEEGRKLQGDLALTRQPSEQ